MNNTMNQENDNHQEVCSCHEPDIEDREITQTFPSSGSAQINKKDWTIVYLIIAGVISNIITLFIGYILLMILIALI